MSEMWKDIDGYEGLYQISNTGLVKSLHYRGGRTPKLLVPKENNSGRLWVELFNNGKKRCALIHRLVGEAFIPNPNKYEEINHKDENPKNNDASNLEWCDRQYNVSYYYKRHPHGAEKKHTEKYKNRSNLKVLQISKGGTVLMQWKNSREIYVKTGMSDWSISECCRGNRKTAYGYIWQYAD